MPEIRFSNFLARDPVKRFCSPFTANFITSLFLFSPASLETEIKLFSSKDFGHSHLGRNTYCFQHLLLYLEQNLLVANRYIFYRITRKFSFIFHVFLCLVLQLLIKIDPLGLLNSYSNSSGQTMWKMG